MVKLKYRLNIFDACVVSMVILASIVIVFSWNNQPYLGSRKVLVSIQVEDESIIKDILRRFAPNAEVCIDSNRYCAKQLAAEIRSDDNEHKYLRVYIEALGDISASKSIFLGKRIYINQEVQLRGDYVADGRVVDYYYAD